MDKLPESTNSSASLTSEPEKLLPVIQADEQAALAMLEHAFRNVSPRALKDVSFGDISQAFARHRGDRETGEPCEACGKPVEVGQVVLCYDDAGEMHADCERPFALDYTREDGEPEPVVLLGSPMRHVVLSRLSSPVSGTDMVPADLRTMSERATPGPWAWEQCGDKEDAPVVGIVLDKDDAPIAGRFDQPIDSDDADYYRGGIAPEWHGEDGCSASANAAFAVAAVNYVRSLLSTSPTPPIPMIAEAGERDTAQAHDHARSGDYRMAYLKMCEAYGKHTPATLDNTAVRVTGGWTPRVGEEVRTTDAVHEQYGEWRGAQLWVAEVRAERNRGDRLNITVTDQWPMGKQADLTDGFYVGGDALDDLCPVATLTAKTEKAE